jgi:4,5-DOPA dioxygenase extradiol
MDRKHFIKTLALFPLASTAMKINELSSITAPFGNSDKMPVLFLGHGSPMNAIEENEFVTGFRTIGKDIQKPNAILCISAHWETRGTFVTAMDHPRTIHDFGGFPQALFDVQYPAKGNPILAEETAKLITSTQVGLDNNWGLDHGTWTVVRHMYPDADIPVLQLSIDYNKPPQYHYDLAKELAVLRRKGVLIIGSGNMVHNLRMVAWDKLNEPEYGFDWANEMNSLFKQKITDNDFKSLINYQSLGTAAKLAIPTPDHYYPLLYTLGLQNGKDEISFFNDKAVGGSLTMTSVKIG